MQFLLTQGADTNATNQRFATPLHLAISGDCDIATVKLLVQSGANSTLPTMQESRLSAWLRSEIKGPFTIGW